MQSKKNLKELEQELSKTCGSFKGFTKEMYDTFLKKQAMYGSENISLGGDMSNTKDRKLALL